MHAASVEEADEQAERRGFTILYGTQGGNAQDVAERIGRQAQRRHVGVRICAMDDYDIVSARLAAVLTDALASAVRLTVEAYVLPSADGPDQRSARHHRSRHHG